MSAPPSVMPGGRRATALAMITAAAATLLQQTDGAAAYGYSYDSESCPAPSCPAKAAPEEISSNSLFALILVSTVTAAVASGLVGHRLTRQHAAESSPGETWTLITDPSPPENSMSVRSIGTQSQTTYTWW